MRVRTFVKFFIFLFTVSILVFIGYSVFVYKTIKPPIEEINLARESLASAKNKMAGRYANETLKEAENLYNWSMKEWKTQNSRFFLFRDYTLTQDLALKSAYKSTNAGNEAKSVKTKLKNGVETELSTLKNQIERFEKYYKTLALNKTTINAFNKGKTRFLEAQIEYKKNDFQQAAKLAKRATESVSQAEKTAHVKLIGFFENYPDWEKNIKLAYNLSKRGQTVILVDKIQSVLIILKGGKEYKTFQAEFGISWMGDKMHAGDKATPEGVYKVVEKKSGPRTIYYKALLINYPNNEDQKRYDKMVKSGEISRKTGIGGLIEIHGDGGKGINWTDGCVALENKEMDVVYNLSAVNTPVIIVGSRLPLEEYFN
ncbi:MAG: ErfK/YbiS/YcfS/YnhG family [Prolixibacteraceae bacterium]|nr:MAG: ErfK/YbiS/YcfS/YnhG family [Prolixibacteraceae bacterium]